MAKIMVCDVCGNKISDDDLSYKDLFPYKVIKCTGNGKMKMDLCHKCFNDIWDGIAVRRNRKPKGD